MPDPSVLHQNCGPESCCFHLARFLFLFWFVGLLLKLFFQLRTVFRALWFSPVALCHMHRYIPLVDGRFDLECCQFGVRCGFEEAQRFFPSLCQESEQLCTCTTLNCWQSVEVKVGAQVKVRKANENHTKCVYVLRAPCKSAGHKTHLCVCCGQDLSETFLFLLKPKCWKISNYTNTCRYQSKTERIWKIPNHKRDLAEMYGCN